MSPKSTMRPLRDGVMSVVKIFTVGKPAWIASASWPENCGGGSVSTMMWWAQSHGQLPTILLAHFDRLASPCRRRARGRSRSSWWCRRAARRGRHVGPAVISGVPSGLVQPCAVHVRIDAAGHDDVPVASITRLAELAASAPTDAIAAMVSPDIATSPRTTPRGVTTSPPEMMRSNIVPPDVETFGPASYRLIRQSRKGQRGGARHPAGRDPFTRAIVNTSARKDRSRFQQSLLKSLLGLLTAARRCSPGRWAPAANTRSRSVAPCPSSSLPRS